MRCQNISLLFFAFWTFLCYFFISKHFLILIRYQCISLLLLDVNTFLYCFWVSTFFIIVFRCQHLYDTDVPEISHYPALFDFALFTLSLLNKLKVFNRKEKSESSSSSGGDYLNNHFSGIRYSADKQKFIAGSQRGGANGELEDTQQKVFRKQKDLEKLLLKADSENISLCTCYLYINLSK